MFEELPSPYKLLEIALGIDERKISREIGMNKTPIWDSLAQVQVMLALERYYGISINNESIQRYQNLVEIENLYFEILRDKEANLMYEVKQTFSSYDGAVLEGTLTVVPNPIGGALLVHGILSDRNELGFYKRMSREFAAHGIASFRFDYRCHGSNQIPSEEFSLLGIVNDIDAAYEVLSHSIGHDNFLSILVGTSFGGGVSAYWANRTRAIDLLFLCAPVLRYEEDINEYAGNWRKDINTRGFAEYAGEMQIGRALFNEVPHIDAVEALRSLSCPVIIFHGTDDEDVPIASSERVKSDKVKLVYIDGVGHGFGIPGDEDLTHPETLAKHNLVYSMMLAEIQKMLGQEKDQ